MAAPPAAPASPPTGAPHSAPAAPWPRLLPAPPHSLPAVAPHPPQSRPYALWLRSSNPVAASPAGPVEDSKNMVTKLTVLLNVLTQNLMQLADVALLAMVKGGRGATTKAVAASLASCRGAPPRPSCTPPRRPASDATRLRSFWSGDVFLIFYTYLCRG